MLRQEGSRYKLLRQRGPEGLLGPSYVAEVFVFPGSICLLLYKSKNFFAGV
jgi:hypothetical protein